MDAFTIQRLIIALALLSPLPALADSRISPDSGSHSYPSVCARPDGFAAVWESSSEDGLEISLQLLDPDGRPLGSPSRINQETNGDQQLPDIACRADGSFIAIWESRGQDGDGLGVFARNFGVDGSPAGNEFQVNTYTTDHQRRPRICIDPEGQALIGWDSVGQDGSGTGIYVRRLDADSTLSGDETLVPIETENNQSEVALACSGEGRRLVAWTDQKSDGSPSEVLARIIHADGTLDSQVISVSSSDSQDRFNRHASATALDSRNFVVALESGGSVIVQTALVFDPDTGDSRTVRSLYPAGRNEAPIVATDESGNILLAWSQGTGFAFDIGAMRTTGGVESPTMLNPSREGNDGAVSTLGRGIGIASAADGNGDLVVWQKRNPFADDSDSSIWAQRFEDCIGDCSSDGKVRINELIIGVRIALNQAQVETCISFDADNSGRVEINELIRAVSEALGGICPAPVG